MATRRKSRLNRNPVIQPKLTSLVVDVPCPFCLEKQMLATGREKVQLVCKSCGARGPERLSVPAATKEMMNLYLTRVVKVEHETGIRPIMDGYNN